MAMRRLSRRPWSVTRSMKSNGVDQGPGDAVAAPDHADANAVIGASGGFLAEEILENIQQRGDFAIGALPVVGREGVESERADGQAGRGADHASHGFYAGAMALPNEASRGKRPSGRYRQAKWQREASNWERHEEAISAWRLWRSPFCNLLRSREPSSVASGANQRFHVIEILFERAAARRRQAKFRLGQAARQTIWCR